jgi:hypothetical protein
MKQTLYIVLLAATDPRASESGVYMCGVVDD